jgi:hypothetical protein
LSGLRIGHFEWSPFAEEIAAIRADPISRLVRTDGARVVEVSAGVPQRLFVTDFVWSNWGRARSFGVFSTFVSK